MNMPLGRHADDRTPAGEAAMRRRPVELVVRKPRPPSGGGGLPQMVHLEGDLVEATCPALGAALFDGAAMPTDVVVDLSAVQTVSPAAAQVLAACAHRLRGRGRQMSIFSIDPAVRRVLEVSGALSVSRLLPAGSADLPPDDTARRAGGRSEADLRAEMRELRMQVRTRPLISQALGILMERYRLADAQSAFRLLRAVSQQRNVKLRVLASALVTVPRPAHLAGPWFPGRARTAAPLPGFLRSSGTDTGNRGAILAAAIDTACVIADTDLAGLHLVDRGDNSLVLETHRGLAEDIVDQISRADTEDLPCSHAWTENRRVAVADLHHQRLLPAGPVREVLISAGIRAAQSTPVRKGSGRGLGVVSTYTTRPGDPLPPSAAAAMDGLAADLAEWLRWYQRNVVLDALEHLHHLASVPADPRREGAGRPADGVGHRAAGAPDDG